MAKGEIQIFLRQREMIIALRWLDLRSFLGCFDSQEELETYLKDNGIPLPIIFAEAKVGLRWPETEENYGTEYKTSNGDIWKVLRAT